MDPPILERVICDTVDATQPLLLYLEQSKSVPIYVVPLLPFKRSKDLSISLSSGP